MNTEAIHKANDNIVKIHEINEAIVKAIESAKEHNMDKPYDIAIFVKSGLREAGYTIVRNKRS